MALSAQNRLTKELDIKKVLKSGAIVRGASLFIKFIPSVGLSRFAISISSKTSPTSVGRNKMKRAISDEIRSSALHGGQTYDTVIVVTKDLKDNAPALKEELRALLHRVGII